MSKRCKGIYSRYDEDKLKAAVSAVRLGNLSQRKAAIRYGVPKTTIADHVAGRVAEGAKPGRNPSFL